MSKAIDLVNQLLALTPTGNERQPKARRVVVAKTTTKSVYVPPTITEDSARKYLLDIANAGKRPATFIDDNGNEQVKLYTAGPYAGQPVMDTIALHIRTDQAKAVIAFLGEKAYHPSQHGSAILRANAEAKRVLNPEPVTDKPYSRGTAAVANGFTPGTPVRGEREHKDMIAKRDLLICYAIEAEKKGDKLKAEAFRKGAQVLTDELSSK
jgi:hypothetical protein